MNTLILIVDDDDLFREQMADFLMSAGFEVVEAANGLSALTSLPHRAPALIILDIRMPTMTGVEFRKELQRRAQWQWVPILEATASREGYLECVARHGELGCIQKPIDFDLLLSRVHHLIMAPPTADPERWHTNT